MDRCVALPPVSVANVKAPHCCTASHVASQTQKTVFWLVFVVLLGDDSLDGVGIKGCPTFFLTQKKSFIEKNMK